MNYFAAEADREFRAVSMALGLPHHPKVPLLTARPSGTFAFDPRAHERRVGRPLRIRHSE